MLAVFSAADAALLVAIVSSVVGPLVVLWYQARVHRDNRDDHAQTVQRIGTLTGAVGELRAGQLEIKADLSDVKADVRSLKQSDRDHDVRLGELEHPTPKTRTPRKRAAS